VKHFVFDNMEESGDESLYCENGKLYWI